MATLSNGASTVQWVVYDSRNRLRPFAPLYIPVTLRTSFGARPARLVLGLQQHSLQVPHLDGVRDLLPTSQRAVSLGVKATEVELYPGICKSKYNNHRPIFFFFYVTLSYWLASIWWRHFGLNCLFCCFVCLFLSRSNCAVLQLGDTLESGAILCFWNPTSLEKKKWRVRVPFCRSGQLINSAIHKGCLRLAPKGPASIVEHSLVLPCKPSSCVSSLYIDMFLVVRFFQAHSCTAI